jgi:hypothetical protein
MSASSSWPLAAIVTIGIMAIALIGRFVIKPRVHGQAAQRLVDLTLVLCAVTLVATVAVFAIVLS